MGHNCKVKLVKKVNGGKDYGEWDFDKKIIKLEKINENFSQDQQDEYFFHELVHSILDHISYLNLSEDEDFIKRFSRVLHQVFKTMK